MRPILALFNPSTCYDSKPTTCCTLNITMATQDEDQMNIVHTSLDHKARHLSPRLKPTVPEASLSTDEVHA
jgi:hypothetical protein